MALFRRVLQRVARRVAMPSAARQSLGLGGQRVLAWSALQGGGWTAATPAGLRALLPTGVQVDRPWTEVDHVAWDQSSNLLAVWWVGSRQPTPLELTEGSFLPEVVHERVRSSVVLSMDVEVPVGSPVRVALRKAPDGTLSTQVIPGRGARLKDPGVAAVVEQARSVLREQAGLPPGV